MKYLQFMMIGGKDYVDQCMEDELIQENLVRNIQGAAEIGGRVQIVLSDKASKIALQEKLLELGVSKEELKSLQVVEERKLLEVCKNFLESGIDPRGADKFKMLLGFKGDPKMGLMYQDTLKLLTLYNAPKGQIVEFADLDQQVDIRQNPNFSISGDAGLYTSMHLGEHPNDSAYRRHDMNKGELIKYYRNNPESSNRPYTNERSYLVGRGGDEKIMKVLFSYVGNIPHFFINDYFSSLSYQEKVRIGSAGISDAAMSPEVRETLIKRVHIDFNQTSLLPRERAQGKEVGFEHLEREKPANKKDAQQSFVKIEDIEISSKEEQVRVTTFLQESPVKITGGRTAISDFEIPSGIIDANTQNQNSIMTPSNVFAGLTVVALGAVLLRRMFGGGNAAKTQKNSGGGGKAR